MNTAFLLAAGLGTRLRPLTLFRPKPLLPLCGASLLDHALAHLRAHGHERVLVNAHHLWEQVAAWAVEQRVELQVELPDVLGTGGALQAGEGRLAERFVVVNGDVLSDVDLTALFARCPADGAAMALRASPDATAIGPVEADGSGKVVRMTHWVQLPGGVPGTHFTGIHAMSRGLIGQITDGDVRTAWRERILAGKVGALLHAGQWVDIGAPDTYLRANLDVLDGRLRPPIDPWTRGERGPGGSFIGEGARVEGDLSRSVVGAGAVVPSGASLRDCVVWDGATVPDGEHRRRIFYDGGGVLDVPALP
jgi:mannose-1-phosphate guanylyltransferase